MSSSRALSCVPLDDPTFALRPQEIEHDDPVDGARGAASSTGCRPWGVGGSARDAELLHAMAKRVGV